MDFSGAFSWMNIRFLLEGLKVTVEVSLFSIVFSFLIGGLTGVIRFSNIPYFSKILGFVIDIIRNLPLLLIIFFTYFSLPQIGIHMNDSCYRQPIDLIDQGHFFGSDHFIT